MRLAVLTAVLLSVGVLNTVTADLDLPTIWDVCKEFPEPPCGDGWTHFDENRCVKYVKTAKSFQDAQDECRSSDGDLLSLLSAGDVTHLLCLTLYTTAASERQAIWIEPKKLQEDFAYLDGSEWLLEQLYLYELDKVGGEDHCIEMGYKVMGAWNDVPCSKKNYFVCEKNSKGIIIKDKILKQKAKKYVWW